MTSAREEATASCFEFLGRPRSRGRPQPPAFLRDAATEASVHLSFYLVQLWQSSHRCCCRTLFLLQPVLKYVYDYKPPVVGFNKLVMGAPECAMWKAGLHVQPETLLHSHYVQRGWPNGKGFMVTADSDWGWQCRPPRCLSSIYLYENSAEQHGMCYCLGSCRCREPINEVELGLCVCGLHMYTQV